jgi:hypothetical protein
MAPSDSALPSGGKAQLNDLQGYFIPGILINFIGAQKFFLRKSDTDTGHVTLRDPLLVSACPFSVNSIGVYGGTKNILNSIEVEKGDSCSMFSATYR